VSFRLPTITLLRFRYSTDVVTCAFVLQHRSASTHHR